jgi:hypothetical protein
VPNMIDAMKESEAVEIGLRSGHILYGRFKELIEGRFVVRSPEGELVFIPADDGNVAYVKLVAADPELNTTIDKLYGKRTTEAVSAIPEEEEPPSRRVDVPPVILPGAPTGRQVDIEQIKERWRHNTSFTVSQTRPAFRPRIQTDEGDKEDK